jgi:hypothetical protein
MNVAKNICVTVPDIFIPMCVDNGLTSLVLQAGTYCQDNPEHFIRIAEYFNVVCKFTPSERLQDSAFQDLSLMIQAYLEMSDLPLSEQVSKTCIAYLDAFTRMADDSAKVEFICSHLNLEYYAEMLKKFA